MSLIRTDYIISPYQTGKWVLEVSGAHFIINDDTKKLVDILSVSSDYNTATQIFNSDFKDHTFNENEFSGFVEKVFENIPIFDSSTTQIQDSKSFIKFQKKLLSADLAGKIASYIAFIFNKKLFWLCFSVLALIGIYIIFTTSFSSIQNVSALRIFLFYSVTILLHELGHITACKRFTGKNGEIGFGIYFIFPVMYSNISSIWHASKEERVITNLAGIYMQFWSMLGFYVFHLLTDNASALYLSYFIAVYCFIQVIPFIRSDGYWLLSDLTSTSNLLEKSGTEVKTFIKNPFNWQKEKREKKFFLLCYGIFNNIILIYFIVTLLIFHWKKIFHFPVDLFNMIKQAFTFNFDMISLPDNFITIIIFYILLFNYLSSFYRRFFSSDQ